ncbi:MAG: Gfo/Idh/MocA family oxidoreductase, partial [Lentisphaeria bacterium]
MRESLHRGIHVFCEKPIAITLHEADEIEAAWKKGSAHIRSMVGLRYEAPFQQAASLVKAGAIGKIKLIRSQKSYKLGKRPDFYRKRTTYGGTIPWVGSHAIDWILFFSGA